MPYFLILLLVAGAIWWWLVRNKKPTVTPLTPTYLELLEKHVPYYASLTADKKQRFADRVSRFLDYVHIDGVDTPVDDLDKVLVASSAIIPIFAFDGWEYPNLTTVLLYPNRFNEAYETEGGDRAILGQVGEGGALQSTMALSKPALHAGFAVETSKENTGIHEFVHLLDKVDGSIDGTPDYMIPREYLQPWLRQIHQNIQQIKANKSDINPYGITNEAEFFAVVSEYFFKRPDLLQAKHPELFEMLELIFRQHPLEPDKGVDADTVATEGEAKHDDEAA
ncbi:M90 family metallopeptidase [Fibrella forsythiae]|uniref:Zinc-dependent peptidase n=1 Tax=Fibrella forsythiae TaxID=2817061 RepID=A0ABS3JDB6_9BACT|nr:M90 family metallopeptidase [Fibrella forsythiae]MBO0947994.1 zinc-dependent peptidase [Fibrella forsythiae]